LHGKIGDIVEKNKVVRCGWCRNTIVVQKQRGVKRYCCSKECEENYKNRFKIYRDKYRKTFRGQLVTYASSMKQQWKKLPDHEIAIRYIRSILRARVAEEIFKERGNDVEYLKIVTEKVTKGIHES